MGHLIWPERYDATDGYATYFDNLIAVLDANGGNALRQIPNTRVIIARGPRPSRPPTSAATTC